MSDYREQLSNLRAAPWFREFVNHIVDTECPQVAPYAPDKGLEDWVYSTGQRDGFLSAIQLFGVKIDA